MYTCKNCAGNLQYDIESGKLKCSHCKSLFDPYEVGEEKGADCKCQYKNVGKVENNNVGFSTYSSVA